MLLWPEEALWALETGRLDIRWGKEDEDEDEEQLNQDPVSRDQQHPKGPETEDLDGEETQEQTEDNADEELDLIPMSLQGAYAAFLGEESERGGFLTLERYLVYAGLKRSGFVVLRAEGWVGRTEPPTPKSTTENDKYACIGANEKSESSLLSQLYNLCFDSKDTDTTNRKQGPLVPPNLYRSYNDIFGLLHIIPSWQPHLSTTSSSVASAPSLNVSSSIPDTPSTSVPLPRNTFTTHFNVHRPTPNFRKSAPGPPDTRLSLIHI